MFAPESNNPSPTGSSGPPAPRVLLVDDHGGSLETAEDLLRDLGVLVETARHGAKAVELALRRPYALIFMDLQMPVMGGLEATRRIRAVLGARPPIVALTANSAAEDRQACLDAGMDEHLSKPADRARLQAALQRHLPPGSLPERAEAPVRWSVDDEAAMQALTQRLTAVAGFDLAGSLRNLNGHLPRLMRVLRRFADTYRHGEPALPQAASQADPELAWQLCHSLRGACATLCAQPLVERIQGLEAALVQHAGREQRQTQAAQLQAELIALSAALDGALRG